MATVVLENLSKEYDGHRVLENVSLSFEDETTTAVVGPSGSGKSTILRSINGLVRPTEGRVLLFGRPIDYTDLPKLRLRIGYAVQGTGLFPHMSVRDNITVLARLNGWSVNRIRARIDELMKLVELEPRLESRYPDELSGGEQQRVGLCRSMMLNPPVFLLDEPFGALDPITRAEVHREFLRLQASEPRTIILVTHDLAEALKLASRLVVLDRGKVIQHDTREAVVEKPANDFVRELFQSQFEND